MALKLKVDGDIPADIIYKAAEIEAYITNGKNPRLDFQSSVETAIGEVESALVGGVSNASKKKVIDLMKHWLKEYDAL